MTEHFRQATPDDADEIAILVNSAYRPGATQRGWTHESDLIEGDRISAEQLRGQLDAGAIILLWINEEAIVACVQVTAHDGYADIGMLATAPSQQAQGVGKRMLQRAEEYARAQCGALRYRMFVLSSRPELLAFYERRGYQRADAIAPYPTDAGVGRPKVEDLQLFTLHKAAG